eukprot:9007-Amphidinium_carterae.3
MTVTGSSKDAGSCRSRSASMCSEVGWIKLIDESVVSGVLLVRQCEITDRSVWLSTEVTDSKMFYSFECPLCPQAVFTVIVGLYTFINYSSPVLVTLAILALTGLSCCLWFWRWPPLSDLPPIWGSFRRGLQSRSRLCPGLAPVEALCLADC